MWTENAIDMPEIPESLIPKERPTRQQSEIIQWRMISYRAVALYGLAIVLVVAGGLIAINPKWREAVLTKLGAGSGANLAEMDDAATRQARFTNLDGGVRVRKADSVVWKTASLSEGLDQGDLVQTDGDGVARIAFADGTLYVVRPNTLIAIEENLGATSTALAKVAVQVTSGIVDLSTTRSMGDSRVKFADAEARLKADSRALVRNDPTSNTREITVSKGGASMSRGADQIELGEYEQASFADAASPLVRRKVVAPPLLLTPANMAPVVMTGTQTATEVEFTWATVSTADSYRIVVSTSPLLQNPVFDQRVRSTSVRLPAFKVGAYYWTVVSLNAQGKESQQSEPNQFSVLHQANSDELLLVVDRYVQHGRVIAVEGRTEPGATVLVNNEPVFNVAANGSFKHFTSPLPATGSTMITVTAQNSKGKVSTVRKAITIQ